MPINNITSTVISTLGNKESLIPIMIKDGVDSGSLTYHSYKAGGIIEGKDRAIDEFGTQAIWIGGIPFYKKIFDASIYKKADFHPGLDTRVISNPEYAKWAKENAKGIMQNDGFLSKLKFLQPKEESVKNAINKALTDGGEKSKKLYSSKVIASTALTLASFFLMTKVKQKTTKDSILEKLNNKKNNENNIENNKDYIFKDIISFSSKPSNTSNSPSFKGNLKDLSDAIMYNPVHNMKVIDAGITTERLACSRNKTELMEHAIKEGGFLFFLYCFGDLLEKGINKLSLNKLNIPIDTSINVIMDEELKKALDNKTIKSDISKFDKNANLTDKLNFIINNPENILVKSAKKSEIVSETKDIEEKFVVDTSKYIDMKKFDKLSDYLKNIEDKFLSSGLTSEKFINKMKGMKIASVGANIVASCAFLGYFIPKAVYKYREKKTGTKEYHVENDIKKGMNI